MKILFIGDASNYHKTLADAMRKLGHDAIVASNGSRWMQTQRNIDISRRLPSKIGGLALWLNLNTFLSDSLKGYDVVHISNPVFLDLKPNKVKHIFNKLKQNNKSVFLTALGTDTPYVKMCIDPNSKLSYNEWQIYGKPSPLQLKQPETIHAWLNNPLKDHCQFIYDNIDGAVSVLYEYDLACRTILPEHKIAYAGIPIDTQSLIPAISFDTVPSKVKLFLGMHNYRKEEKGTDRILAAAKRVSEQYPDKCELKIVENIPYSEYIEIMRHSHVLLDQLYSYTPATNALIGMSYGLTTVSGAEPEYYDFIGEFENRPIVNAIPDDEQLRKTIEQIVLHPELIPIRAKQGRDFVVKHNDSIAVAQRFVNFWNNRINARL